MTWRAMENTQFSAEKKIPRSVSGALRSHPKLFLTLYNLLLVEIESLSGDSYTTQLGHQPCSWDDKRQ